MKEERGGERPALQPLSTRKRNSHSKNAPPKQEELRAHLKRTPAPSAGAVLPAWFIAC